MKLQRSLPYLACFHLTLFLICLGCKADRSELALVPSPGFSITDLQGSWIGWAQGMDDLFLYRLSVTGDAAAIGKDFNGRTTTFAQLCDLRVNGATLSSRVQQSGSSDIQIFSGVVRAGVISAAVRGTGWQHEVVFHRESTFDMRRGLLKNVMR